MRLIDRVKALESARKSEMTPQEWQRFREQTGLTDERMRDVLIEGIRTLAQKDPDSVCEGASGRTVREVIEEMRAALAELGAEADHAPV